MLAVEYHFAEIFTRTMHAQHDLPAILIAHVDLHMTGNEDEERVGIVTLTDDNRVSGITLDHALRGQIQTRIPKRAR